MTSEPSKPDTTQETTKRLALVTGANRGIGFEIAKQLARKQMTVLMGSRDSEKGMAAANRLSEQGLDAHFIMIDMTETLSIENTVSRIKDEFYRLDILVNNAGILIDSETSLLELSITLFQNTLETNAFGPLLLSQACVPLMKANQYGRIVNMASTLGSLTDIASPDSSYAQVQSPAYRLSKTLLNGITVLLAKELRGTNILVNSACPGWVNTDMGGEAAPLSPEQGANTPVWLATLPDGGPTGGFFREQQPIPW
jgi:NAD(P)-dependent dehydrogenase (short-subunit alcohol dehydrogenase family)